MKDALIIAALLIIVGLAVWYIVKAKKSGKKCMGCPEGCCPHRGNSSACTCQQAEQRG